MIRVSNPFNYCVAVESGNSAAFLKPLGEMKTKQMKFYLIKRGIRLVGVMSPKEIINRYNRLRTEEKINKRRENFGFPEIDLSNKIK